MTTRGKIIKLIKDTPGLSAKEIAEILGGKETSSSISGTLYYLFSKKKIQREGKRGCGHGFGYTYYPISRGTSAASVLPSSPTLVKSKSLSDYTPRELLEELKRRGYVWDKMWVVTKQYVEFNKI